MSENKCYGNCKHFNDEDIEGFSYCEIEHGFKCCEIEHGFKCCDEVCVEHEAINNCWTEITPDNVEELYESKERVCVAFVCNGEVSYMCGQFGLTLSTMAKYGGYYYYVLPELKIE